MSQSLCVFAEISSAYEIRFQWNNSIKYISHTHTHLQEEEEEEPPIKFKVD